jgi:hypothetical protein
VKTIYIQTQTQTHIYTYNTKRAYGEVAAEALKNIPYSTVIKNHGLLYSQRGNKRYLVRWHVRKNKNFHNVHVRTNKKDVQNVMCKGTEQPKQVRHMDLYSKKQIQLGMNLSKQDTPGNTKTTTSS